VFSHDDFSTSFICTGITWAYQAFEIVGGVDQTLPNFITYSSKSFTIPTVTLADEGVKSMVLVG
jgi:hypothetical protein